MQKTRHRPWAAAVLVLALTIIPFASAAADEASDYVAACSTRLRAGPSLSAATLETIPTGAIVTTIGTVPGDAWSATCVAAVSGTTWYQITAVNGVSVLSRYGTSVVYAATGLFQAPTYQPPSPYVEGIDVSRYQGSINWPLVGAAGKRFVFMRATLGHTYVDPTYATNHAGARAAGLQVAAYHYATPSASPGDAILEARWFVQNAALQADDLLPALDIEQTGGLSLTDLQAWVGAWLAEVQAWTGVRPIIYTSPNFWKNSLGGTTMFAGPGGSPLWVAHWFVTSPSVPATNWGGSGWTFWQYDNCGSVPGIIGCVDLDRYRDTDLTRLTLGHSVSVPTPSPNPAPIVTAVSPTTIQAGGAETTLTVQGANFASGISTVHWDGAPLSTTYVSPNQLTAALPSVRTPGTAMVTVAHPPPGGGVSLPVPVVITEPPAQLVVTPSTTVITWGQSVTLYVNIEGLRANRTVSLQRKQANETEWSTIATLTTDAVGRASVDYRPPVNTEFQAVFADTPDPGPGASAPVRVVVRQLIVLRPTSSGQTRSVSAGTRVTFTGTVRPVGPTLAQAKVTFAFWRRVDGRWVYVTKRDVYADASGRASWTWAFTSRGQWYVRAVANPTQTNANSYWSQVERYSVN